MVLRRWWRKLFSAPNPRRPRARRSPLNLEPLEDRVVPALQVVSSIAPELLTSTSSTTANDASQVTDMHALSSDGRYAVFASLGTNVVNGQSDINSNYDVFLYDRQTGTNLLISGAGGSDTTTANGESFNPVISANGRYVAFVSTATDLISGQTGGTGSGVYLYDTQKDVLKLVSHTSTPATENADASAGMIDYFLSISDKGEYVAYLSDADNLVSSFSGSGRQAYLDDTSADTNTLVSHKYGSTATGGDDNTNYVTISGNGSKVVLTSDSSNLVQNQSDPLDSFYGTIGVQDTDIFVYDVSTGGMSLVSHESGSTASNLTTTAHNTHLGFVDDVVRPSITPDGKYIVYAHPGDNIVSNQDNNGQEAYNVFRYETSTGTNVLISHKYGSTDDLNTAANYPDGTLTAFITHAWI